MWDQRHCYFNILFIVCLSMVLFVFSFVFLFYLFGLAIRNLWLAICFQPSRNSLDWKGPFPLFLGTKDQHKTQRAAKDLTGAHVNKR